MKPKLIALFLLIAVVTWMTLGLLNDNLTEDHHEDISINVSETRKEFQSVQVLTSKAKKIAPQKIYYGKTIPDRLVLLRAQTTGEIIKIGAARGEHVKTNELLAQIKPGGRPSRLIEAEAAYQQRKLEYQSTVKLHQKGFQSDQALSASKAALASAESALEAIQIDVGHTDIKAPFDGVLQQRDAEVGDFVTAGDLVAEVVDLNPLKVTVDVNEQEYLSLQTAADIEIVIFGQKLSGTLSYQGKVANDETRTFEVEVIAPQPDPKKPIPAGLSISVHAKQQAEFAHQISPGLLALNKSGTLGLKCLDGMSKVIFYPVKIIKTTAEGVWVTGLPEIARIITVGAGFVAAGERVEVHTPKQQTTS